MNIIKRVLRIVITGYLVKWIRNKIEGKSNGGQIKCKKVYSLTLI